MLFSFTHCSSCSFLFSQQQPYGSTAQVEQIFYFFTQHFKKIEVVLQLCFIILEL